MATDKKKDAAARKAQLAKMSDAEKKIFVQKEKAANFRKLAELRVSRALTAIASVQVLANRKRYVYEDAEATKIKDAMENAVKDVSKAFDGGGSGGAFKL